MSAPPATQGILVVDDDPVALFITRSHLSKAGFRVSCVGSVSEARKLISEQGFDHFSAVVSDYRMPVENGLAMLQYCKEGDPTLGVIMATAEGEKTLIANSLRGGAVDFLDKPFSGTDLIAAVRRAIELTLSQRTQSSAVKEVSQIGQSQRMLLGQSTAALGNRFRVFFRPNEKAGGDFVAAFPLSEESFVVLVSDVSGHDLQAAYRSAYLQGFARALLSNGTSIESTFDQLNRVLMTEWNMGDEEILSLAACAAVVDNTTQTLKVLNCGLPAPHIIDREGWPQVLTHSVSSPLGWFQDLPLPSTWAFTHDRLLFWSDGLDDLAERIGCDPLALACRLQGSSEEFGELFNVSNDDIICVQIDLDSQRFPGVDEGIPLLAQNIPGSDHVQIDALQNFIERSISVALPRIPPQVLHDSTICAREALLNALQHGCGGLDNAFATVQVIFKPRDAKLVVRISDPGPGHHFDFLRYEEIANKELLPAHHGLLMIRYLSQALDISPEGNVLTMHFSLNSQQ